MYGGDSGEAFLALTGGCTEFIDFDDENYLKGEPNKTLALHRRLKNAIANGECMLTADVPVCLKETISGPFYNLSCSVL